MTLLAIGVEVRFGSFSPNKVIVVRRQRNDDCLSRSRIVSEDPRDLKTVDLRHRDIEKHDVWLPVACGRDRGAAAVHGFYFELTECKVCS
nr:hypothetical protein [Caballeronia temeraria]